MVEKQHVWFCGLKNAFIYTETCRYLKTVNKTILTFLKAKIKVMSNNSSSNTPNTPQDRAQVTWAPADGKDSPSSLILSAVMLWRSILRHIRQIIYCCHAGVVTAGWRCGDWGGDGGGVCGCTGLSEQIVWPTDLQMEKEGAACDFHATALIWHSSLDYVLMSL